MGSAGPTARTILSPPSTPGFQLRFWPTAATLVGLCLLIALGSWQLSRFLDARAFEQARDATMDLPVVSLDDARDLVSGELDFRHVQITGRWHQEVLFLIKHRVYQGTPGFWVVQPLYPESAQDDDQPTAIMVNRGWLSVESGDDAARNLLEATAGQQGHAQGLLHRLDDVVTDRRMLAVLEAGETPTGVIELETYDITAMQQIVGDTAIDRPIVLTEAGTTDRVDPSGLVASTQHITEPYLTAETHFGYMLTWYILALALIAIWIAHGLGLLSSPAYRDRPTREG